MRACSNPAIWGLPQGRASVRATRSRGYPRASHRRRGAIAIIVLVCLVIVSSICAQLLRVAHSARTHEKKEEQTLQAEWLVESGLERASARLADNPRYEGETWEIPAKELGGQFAGRVTIHLATAPSPGHPDQKRCEIRADYPSDRSERSRLSKIVLWEPAQLPPGGPR